MKVLVSLLLYFALLIQPVCAMASQSLSTGALPFPSFPQPIGKWLICGDTTSSSGCVPTSSTAAYDSSGGGNDGTWHGTQSGTNFWYSASTLTGLSYAGNFNGTNNYLSTAPATTYALSSGSLTAWINTTVSATSFYGIGAKNNAFGLFVYGGTLIIYDWGGAALRNSGVAVNDGNWHFVAETFQSGVTNGTKLYVDGSLALTTTMTVANQTQAFLIGNGSASQFFLGKINDVRIYNTVLTSTQISTLYAAGY